MSIATEIARLRTAKTNIISSLEDKGVTVPANTTYSGISALIDSIPDPVPVAISGSVNGTTVGGRTYDVTITFNDVVKGRGGTIYLLQDAMSEVTAYQFIIKMNTDGSIKSWSGGSKADSWTINSESWNTAGDVLTAQVFSVLNTNSTLFERVPVVLWVP